VTIASVPRGESDEKRKQAQSQAATLGSIGQEDCPTANSSGGEGGSLLDCAGRRISFSRADTTPPYPGSGDQMKGHVTRNPRCFQRGLTHSLKRTSSAWVALPSALRLLLVGLLVVLSAELISIRVVEKDGEPLGFSDVASSACLCNELKQFATT
jgi:hypothetical protein